MAVVSMSPLIELRNFSYTYPYRGTSRDSLEENKPVRALDSLSLSINQGDFILVKGESGSGKSSLILSLCGIIPHGIGGKIAGQLLIEGLDIRETGPTQLSDLAGAAFQNPHNQFFTPTVRDEIAFSLQNRAIPGKEMTIRIKESLDFTGLSGYEDRSPRTLSGGEKQRLLLSILLAWDPPVFLLDEPLSALDPAGAVHVAELLKRLNREKGKTIILVEKRGDPVESIVNRILYMEKGQILKTAPPALAVRKKSPKEVGEPIVREKLFVEDLNFSYSSALPIFKNDSFFFNGGEVTALTGVNGSGKSTLASLIMGLQQPDSGRIVLNDKYLGSYSIAQRAKYLGYLIQNPDYQLFAPSVREEIGFGLKHLSPVERVRQIEETLDFFHLTKLSETPPSLLGFSMRKRVTLACVHARKPLFSLLDEPDWGQDREGLALIEKYLEETLAQGRGVILITHNEELAKRWMDRNITLKGLWRD